jgi:hypothetical protein
MSTRNRSFLPKAILLSTCGPWLLFLTVVLFATISKSADEISPKDPVEHLVAVVQYSRGESELINSLSQISVIRFQTPIYESDRIRIPSNGLLKFVTRQDCTAVIYGSARVRAPKETGPWKINGTEGIRWICPEGSTQQIQVGALSLKIAGGEIFWRGNHLLLLRGQVTGSSGEMFQPLQIYEIKDSKFQIASDSSEQDIWGFNQQKVPPKEATVLLEPLHILKHRLILSGGGGIGKIFHNNSSLNGPNARANSVRLQLQSQHEMVSWIGLLSYSEVDNSSRGNNNQNTNGMPGNYNSGVTTQLSTFSIEGGVRFQHVRWWSPYVRLGLGLEKDKLQVNLWDIGYGSNEEFHYLSFLASAGVDAFYFPAKHFGFYGALEGKLTQTIIGIGSENNSAGMVSSSPNEANNHGGFVAGLDLSAYLGIVAGF